MAKERPEDGRNEGDNKMDSTVAADELRAFIERIERLNEEGQTIKDDIKEVFGEAKGRGYDTKVIRRIIAFRKRDANEVAEEEAIFELYCQALGIRSMTLV